jgi:hypothetical protein
VIYELSKGLLKSGFEFNSLPEPWPKSS